MLKGWKKSKSGLKKKSREPNYMLDMDKVFQYYIRLRDAMPGGYCRCISCGKIKPFDLIQAGHFYSRKHMNTRWNEDNVNAECSGCNCFDGDHLLGYRQNLIKKIGLQKFQYLEVAHNLTRKWADFEIVVMVKHYGEKVLQLSSQKGIPVSKEVLAIIKRYEKK